MYRRIDQLASTSFAAALLIGAGGLWAGDFNKKLSIGDTAPAFADLEGVDGKAHSLAEYRDRELLVLVITCNECPVACDYEDRVQALTKKFAAPDSKVGVVALNVCTGEEEALPAMKKRAAKRGFAFPYLADPTQKIGRALGATVTPEFFVLDRERKVVYMGAMDDHQQPEKVKKRYLEPALDALLKGDKPVRAETAAHGCSIEYKKK